VISVCVATLREAPALASVVRPLVALRDSGLVGEVVIVDGASPEGTIRRVRGLGAAVHRPSTLMSGFGPVLGTGDVLWRALSVLEGDIVCFVDAGVETLDAHDLGALLGPLAGDPAVGFVSGARPHGGGRVGPLTARPLIDAFYPELAVLRQPLPAVFAARRELLEALPFCTGEGIAIALLLAACAHAGSGAVAEVDLGARSHVRPPLEDEAPIAAGVLAAVTRRLHRDGRLAGPVAAQAPPERPALATLMAPAPVPAAGLRAGCRDRRGARGRPAQTSGSAPGSRR
jgi:glucosyl-3-phosphoglycerate synthase